MTTYWTFFTAGTLFVIGGVYGIHKNLFEEGERVVKPSIVALAGIFLLAIGFAKLYGVMD